MVTLNSRTRQDEILQFIQENPGCTKTQTINEMEKRGISSLVTTHKILEDLKANGKKIIVKPDEINHRIHRLTINDESEFHLLRNKINKLKIRVNRLIRHLSWHLYVKRTFKNSESFDSVKQDYLNLLHYAQLDSYAEITLIAKRINKNIRSRADQERLYLKLTEVLNVSDKLNEMLSPQVQSELERLLDKMKNEQDPFRSLIMANMTKEITSIFSNSNSK